MVEFKSAMMKSFIKELSWNFPKIIIVLTVINNENDASFIEKMCLHVYVAF